MHNPLCRLLHIFGGVLYSSYSYFSLAGRQQRMLPGSGHFPVICILEHSLTGMHTPLFSVLHLFGGVLSTWLFKRFSISLSIFLQFSILSSTSEKDKILCLPVVHNLISSSKVLGDGEVEDDGVGEIDLVGVVDIEVEGVGDEDFVGEGDFDLVGIDVDVLEDAGDEVDNFAGIEDWNADGYDGIRD